MMSSQFVETLASIAAGAIMALMVAAGGTAMARVPSDGAVRAEVPVVDRPDPLSLCTANDGLITCVREET